MGGGPSDSQKDAAAAQAAASRAATAQSASELADKREYMGYIKPFALDRLNNGLPFMGAMNDYSNGAIAQSFAPAKADIYRRTSSSDLPSGYRDQMLNDLEASKARAYDSGLMGNLLTNEQSRQNAAQTLTGQAQMLNPLGWQQAAMQGNSSVMNANLQSPGMAGMLGGIAGGVMSKIPF